MDATSNLTIVVQVGEGHSCLSSIAFQLIQDVNNASLATNATIVITLLDVDNLNPIFAFPAYTLNISIDTVLVSELIHSFFFFFHCSRERL